MTAALAREVTCTDCGTTFAGRVGGSRRCGPCTQSRVAAALRARRGEATDATPAVPALIEPAAAPVAPETPSAPPAPDPAARTAMSVEDASRQITCADCGTVFVRTNWGGKTPTRCKPCQAEANLAASRASVERRRKEREATRDLSPGVPRGGVTPTVERAASEMAHRMLTHDPACAGDDRFTAEPSDLAPGDAAAMTRLCRSCPLFEQCLAVAKTTKPAAGFWAGAHRSVKTRTPQETTA